MAWRVKGNRKDLLHSIWDYSQYCLPTSFCMESQALRNIRAQVALLNWDGRAGEKIQNKSAWLFRWIFSPD